MVKHTTRKTRRTRGGAWYNPFTWFSSTPDPVPTQSTSEPVIGVPSSPAPAPAPTPYGGKKRSKTRRGGRYSRNRAKYIYGRR